jgi:hypothetical protein
MTDPRDGQIKKAWAFVMTLSFSRHHGLPPTRWTV